MSKFLMSSGIIAIIFLLFLIGCEAENPGEPIANKLPDTYISKATAGNITTIYFYGTDKDGYIKEFIYKWDNDTEWLKTVSDSLVFIDIFANENEVKTFYVKAIDNLDAEDPYPAEIALSPNNILPETSISFGPDLGDITGEDVQFIFEGSDFEEGGEIVSFQYTLDDLNNWKNTPRSSPKALFLGIAEGAHTFYVRAVDNLGGVDPSPAQTAFISKSGKFAPEIEFECPIENEDIWLSGVDLTFSWRLNTNSYYGILPESPVSYAIDDSTNFNLVSTGPLASGWNKFSSFTLIPDSGKHTFYLKVRDTASGIDTLSLTFDIIPYNPTNGILLIDDFNWIPDGYFDDDHIDSLIAYGFMDGYAFTQREDTSQAITIYEIINYSTVILYSDMSFSNQNNGKVFKTFAKAGGNLMLCGYEFHNDLGRIFPTFGLYPPVLGYPIEYAGMVGKAGTIYEGFNIELPFAYTTRSCYKLYELTNEAQSIFLERNSNRTVGTRTDMPKGNVVIVIGQSLPFMDQAQQYTKEFGNYVLGTEFGETKKTK